MSPSVEEDEGCEAEAYEGAIRAFCFSKRSDPELEMRNGGGVRLTACLTVESLLGIKRQHWFVVGAIGVESARARQLRGFLRRCDRQPIAFFILRMAGVPGDELKLDLVLRAELDQPFPQFEVLYG